MDLSLSHRLTRDMAACVNHVTGAQGGIRSERDGPRVQLLADRDHLQVATYLVELFEARGYAPGDVMVLAKSLDAYPLGGYVTFLINALARRGWPVAAPVGHGERGSEACERGKVLFSTFAGAKGRERKCAVVLGFDDSYLRKGETVCGNDLYVALTRGKEELILVQLEGREPLPFAPPSDASYMERVPPPPPEDDDDDEGWPKTKRAVDKTAKLLRFQSDAALAAAEAHTPSWIELTDRRSEALALPNEVQQPPLLGAPAKRGGASETEPCLEYVGDLNRAALLLLLQGSLGVPLGGAAEAASAAIRSPAEALEVALELKTTSRIHRRAQITRFDWLTEAMAAECVARAREGLALILDVASGEELNAAALRRLKFDHELRAAGAAAADGLERASNGFVDIYDAKTGAPTSVVFEAIAEEHRLRLAALARLAGSAVGFLLNPLTGEVWKLTATPEQLTAAVEVLVRHKEECLTSERLTEPEFTEACSKRW